MERPKNALYQLAASLRGQDEEELRQVLELLFFAYRDFTGEADVVLAEFGFGRAHHRAIHFINGSPGTTVNNLLNILGVTKQSLNRVLRTLVNDKLVEVRVGTRDKRERHLYLTNLGRELQERLSSAQSNRMRQAFKNAGPNAVSGFKTVLEAMMDPELNKIYSKLRNEVN